MSQFQLLKRVATTLESLGIPYMLTGSMASSVQGAPRLTHDIDLVVQIAAPSAPSLVAEFPSPEFHLDEESILDAIRNRGQFNLLQPDTGDKVDFWLLTDDAFDQSRFARRRVELVQGLPLRLSAPEDTILQKLRWAEMSGGSEKQFNDALRVFEVQRELLDVSYLNHWSETLGVTELYRRLQQEAQPL